MEGGSFWCIQLDLKLCEYLLFTNFINTIYNLLILLFIVCKMEMHICCIAGDERKEAIQDLLQV